jgi:CheY-like chemotaxis protein
MPASLAPRLLVVEDSDDDFDTLRRAHEQAGSPLTICRAATGEDALALLRGTDDKAPRPALVLMDLNIPGIDGREALRAIKADPALEHLPVVVLSTSANPKDVAFCYRAGASAYHVKPVRYEDHLALLRAVFGYWLGYVVLPAKEEHRGR